MTDPMIVEYVRVSQEGFNWTPVLQTAIGTFGGFLLGLVAYLIQRGLQRRSDEKEKDDAAKDALKRVLSSATSNIEVIAMLKIQLLEDLAGDVALMKPLVEKAFEDDKSIPALVEQSGKLHHFYKTLPRAYELDPPEFSELSRVVDNMPGLTTFIHRGMTSMAELSAISEERNKLIAEHARENANGMNGDRVRYFASMLTDMGYGMIEMADNAMAFFMIAIEQVESYFDYGVKLDGFTRYRLVPEAQKRLPAKDRFPQMRTLLVDFNEKPLKKRG